MALVTPLIQPAHAKGLKVYLTVDSNQRPQQAAIGTYQDGYRVSEEFYYINQGITEITLQYREGAFENGEFDICVAVSGGIQGCGKGYDGPEKKPEHVRANVHSDFVPVVEEEQNNGNSQSQSQSSNNENNNENNNALTHRKLKYTSVTKEDAKYNDE